MTNPQATVEIEAAKIVARLHRREGLGPFIERLPASWEVGTGLFDLHAVKVAEADGTPVEASAAPAESISDKRLAYVAKNPAGAIHSSSKTVKLTVEELQAMAVELAAHRLGARNRRASPTPAAEGIETFWFNPWNDYHGFQQVAPEYNGEPGLVGMVKLTDHEALISSLTAERDGLTKSLANAWCPNVCPITQRPFFMWIDGEPTYGGPYDSYTIPTRDAEGEYSCRRYDHDEGGWKPWDEGLSLRVLTEEQIFDLEARAEAAEAALATAREALEQITTGRDKDGLKVDFPAIIAGQALDALKGVSTP